MESCFEDNEFNNWNEQLLLLKRTYNLDENSTRVLISSSLEKHALTWFHSKPTHLTINIAELLSEMKQIFDELPKKMNLRKQFEARSWQFKESFAEYFHDKIILGNPVPVLGEEFVDCLIDGIPDEEIKNQARILCFRKKGELFDVFKKITLSAKKITEKKMHVAMQRM